jgi:hypothetical protein
LSTAVTEDEYNVLRLGLSFFPPMRLSIPRRRWLSGFKKINMSIVWEFLRLKEVLFTNSSRVHDCLA